MHAPGCGGALLTYTFTLNAPLAAATAIPTGPAFNITATMPATAGDLTNYASIDPLGGTAYPAPVNCTLPPCTQQTTTIQAPSSPLLTIAKAAPTIVYAGGQLTYSLSIGNMGTVDLAAGTTFTVLDQLWPGATFVSAAPGAGMSGASCNAGVSPMACSVTLATALVAGTPPATGAKFTITVNAPLTAPPVDAFANYVSVSATGVGTPPAPGQACVVDQCASVGTRLAFLGMQLTKTGPATVVAGNTITYTVRLGNSASGLPIPSGTVVLVSDQLPLSDTYLSAAPVSGVSPVSCTSSPTRLVSCSVTLTADLSNGTAPAAGPGFTITATVDPLHVGNDTNYASVAPDAVSTPPPPGPTCQVLNCGAAPTVVVTGASLELAKTGPASIAAGSIFNYTLSLGNGGTGPLAGGTVVLVSDQLPAGTTYLSAAPGSGVIGVVCTPSGGLLSCQVTLAADLAAGTLPLAGPAITIEVTAPSTAGSTTNYASVSTDGTSAPPAPGASCVTANCGSAITNITNLAAPNVVLEKVAPATALVGANVDYSLTLGNLGTADLAAGTVILVDDQLPAGATYVSSAAGSGVSAVTCSSSPTGLVSCSVTLTAPLVAGTAAAGGPAFTITATAPAATGPTTNYAAVAPDGTSTPPVPDDSCTTANCGSAATNVTGVPPVMLKLRKSGPATIIAGSDVVYTIDLVNRGVGGLPAGTVLRVDDQLPVGSTFVSAAGGSGTSGVSCNFSSTGLVSCDVTLATALAPNQENVVNFLLTATASTSEGAVVNYASVAEDGTSDPPTPDAFCADCGTSAAAVIPAHSPTPTPTPEPLSRKHKELARIVSVAKAQKDMLHRKVAALESLPDPAAKRAPARTPVPRKAMQEHGSEAARIAEVVEANAAMLDMKMAALTGGKAGKLAMSPKNATAWLGTKGLFDSRAAAVAVNH